LTATPDYSDVHATAEVIKVGAVALMKFADVYLAADPLDTSAEERQCLAEAAGLVERALECFG
jgi:hypothetical protein